LQLTAFGARDRCFFELIFWSARRRQLKRVPLGGISTERDLTHERD
jgi:hypothetical protein